MATRKSLLAQVHIAAKRTGLEGDVYRDWLEQQTGERSCTKLTVDKLESLVKSLRDRGTLNNDVKGGYGPDRPTPRQWNKFAAMARTLGMSGLEDKRLAGFIRKTAKVSHPRFLSRRKMSQVITGMERWIEYHEAHGGAVSHGS